MFDTVWTGVTRSLPWTLSRTAWHRPIISASRSSIDPVRAFRTGRFSAREFRAYERAVTRGSRPFEQFIELFYDRAFLEVFLRPRNILNMVDAVTGVLAGGSFGQLPRGLRVSLFAFLQVVKVMRWRARREGRVLESRLEW